MKHLLVRFEKCKALFADNILDCMKLAAVEIQAVPLESVSHNFMNGGITALLIISESHISVHTWPERNLVLIDIFTCRECDITKPMSIFKEVFKPSIVKTQIIER